MYRTSNYLAKALLRVISIARRAFCVPLLQSTCKNVGSRLHDLDSSRSRASPNWVKAKLVLGSAQLMKHFIVCINTTKDLSNNNLSDKKIATLP